MKHRLLATILALSFSPLLQCAAKIYYPTVESGKGLSLELPGRTPPPLNVCTLGLASHYDLVDLLEARGHTVIPLWAGSMEQQRSSQSDLNCDVAIVLERTGGARDDSESGPWRFGWIALSWISFSLIPYEETHTERHVFQIINTQSRSTERVLADMSYDLWNSSIAYPVLHYRESNGQYGRARLEYSLYLLSAIEAMGSRGRLPEVSK